MLIWSLTAKFISRNKGLYTITDKDVNSNKLILRMFFRNLYFSLEKTVHENVNIGKFEILLDACKNNKFKRNRVKLRNNGHEKPILNVEEQSVSLKFFKRRRPEVQLESANI